MKAVGYDFLAPVSYGQNSKDVVLSPATGGMLHVGEVTLVNRSGGAIDLAFGYKQPNAFWKAGQIDASETPDYVDDTTDAQDAGTDDFALTTTTNNDGFLVQSTQRFNLVGITISQAAAGGSPVYAYQYYNGSSMAALTPIASANFAAAADTFFSFLAPNDWAKGSTAAVGADSDKYAIQVLATTAPTTTPALAAILWVGSWAAFQPQVANNNAFSFDIPDYEYPILGGAGLLPYFGGTANAANTVQAHYRTVGAIPS